MSVASAAAGDSTARSARLLDEVGSGTSFFFATERQTLVARGRAAELAPRPHDLPQSAAALLSEQEERGRAAPMVVGAIPFDAATPVRLFVPAEVHWAGPLARDAGAGAAPAPPPTVNVRAVPSADEYMHGVERALRLLDARALRKVVLARSLEITLPHPLDLRRVLASLAHSDARASVFAVDVGDERTLFGASPELLVSRSGMRVTANPLAGSAPCSEDPHEDRVRAAGLVASEKDQREHAVVVDAVSAALRPHCDRLDVPRRPSLVRTATMWHLSSRVTGVIADPSISALTLAAALHPTPAVCGAPVDAARDAIRSIEAFDRGYFTGMVGWGDAHGNGEWVVTIRCGESAGRCLRVFAGAGIVHGSSPQAELAETAAKCRTLLRAVGVEHLEQPERRPRRRFRFAKSVKGGTDGIHT